MILPTTYATALLLTIVTMLCWGSWANTFKLTRKWRFELYYFDFAIGVAITALVAALTFGSMGDELSFMDNLTIAGKRQMAYAVVAGAIFNLANMLLVAAVSVAGLSVAFPIGLGLALVIGVIWSFVLKPVGDPLYLFGGAAIVLLAVVIDAFAYRMHTREMRLGVKGLVLSVLGGVLMGSFYPMVELSRATDIGLGPYSCAVFFSVGMLITTLIFNFYFMNLPIQGEPISIGAYFDGKATYHLLGLLGGIVWCIGTIASFVSSSALVTVGHSVSYAMGQGATVVAALWGLLVWKEFAGASGQVKMLLILMLLLFLAGLGLVSLSPWLGQR